MRRDACTASPFPARACAGRASYVDGRQWRAGNNGDGEKGGKMATAASAVRGEGRKGGREGGTARCCGRCAKRGRRGMQNETNDESPGVGEEGYHLTCSWIAIAKNDERLSPRVSPPHLPLPTPLPLPPGILSIAARRRLDHWIIFDRKRRESDAIILTEFLSEYPQNLRLKS